MSTAGRESQFKSLLAKLCAGLGILLALAGLYFITSVVPLAFIGLVLGGVGLALGARKVGITALVVAVLVLLFGLAAFAGLIPGLEAPGYNDQVPEAFE